jgi:hypothetical protein
MRTHNLIPRQLAGRKSTGVGTKKVMANFNYSNWRQTVLAAFGIFFLGLLPADYFWAGYKSPKVKIEPARTYAFHQQQGPVTIAADPYETRDKIKTAFDLKELDEADIVPVHVIITNEGDDTIAISGKDVNLLDSRNRSFQPLPIDEVVRAVVYKGSPRASRSPSPSPLPIPRGSGRRGDAFEIETDLTNKALKDLRIPPKTTSGGFVFFRLPDNRMRLGGYKVYVPEIQNLKTQQNLLFFEIELK